MSKKSVLTSLALITIGIVLGVVIVSSFGNGVDVGFALGGGDVKLGGPVPIATQNPSIKALSDNFAAVSKAVTHSVVAINVTVSGKKGDQRREMPNDPFHWFFGPEFRTPEPQPSMGSGSGVIISTDGYIATNNHVVEGADDDGIEVVMNDRVRYKAKVIGRDPSTDLAVIKVDANSLSPAALGNSDNLQVGEWVLAVGNPLGLSSTVTAGIISAIGRDINIIQDTYRIEGFIQTDAAINPGNSGGALVNMNGEVIGINTAIATTNARYQGYGFAVPVNILKTVAADLIKFGEVKRGYIGVQIQAVDQTMAQALGMKDATGVVVQGLVKGGAGEAAGIKEGDVILSVDGKAVNKGNELQGYIATRHPGDEVTLKIFRDGKTIEKKVTLRARKEEPEVAQAEDAGKGEGKESETASNTVSFDKLGMTVRSLSSDEKKELEVERGVLIAEIKPYSEAFKRSLGKDDVIIEADRKPVNSPGDLKRIVEGKKTGESLLLRVKREPDGQTSFVAVQIPK